MGNLQWLASGQRGAHDFTLDGPGRAVTGALWLPDAVLATTPLVLCGHGASGDRYQAPIPHLAQRFTQAGVAVLAIDGPVHGLRQVGPGGREAFAVEAQRPSFVDDMVTDWFAALSAVRQDQQIGTAALGYFGLSMGTLFGVPVLGGGAAQHGVTFAAAAIGLCGTSGAGAGLRDRLLQDAAKMHMPLAFLMQLEDELFPRDGYLELFDALAAADKRLHANPGLHPEVPAEEVNFVFDFLVTRLAGEVPRRIVNPLAQ